MLRRKEDEKGLCKYLQSESYQVVADMYIQGGGVTHILGRTLRCMVVTLR